MIQKELLGSGQLLGYNTGVCMWRRINRKYKEPVARKTVMCLLAYLDPKGSLERQRNRLQRRMYRTKGPNEVWHCDGYDKLKPFGFSIHGCIDGYSRRIMWLEVCTSNKDPKVIAGFYVKAVSSTHGTPRLLRCDLGSENSIIAYVQPFLRRNNSDSRAGSGSFRYGKSVLNQRIESLWSHVGKSCTYWWINFFRGMAYNDLFTNVNQIHQDCLMYCFFHLIQKDLEQFAREWNSHRIRHNTAAVSGYPNELLLCLDFKEQKIRSARLMHWTFNS